MLTHLTSIVADCIGAADLGAGRYEICLANGTRRDATAEELAAAQAAFDAAEAARAAAADDRAALKTQFQAAADRLQQITDAASPNTTQVVAAVRDMAAIQRKMLRALYGIML